MNFINTAVNTSNTSETGIGNPLWDFSVWVYGEPEVENACLDLQNRLGADVTMLMYCLWLAHRSTPSEHLARYLGAAIKLSRDWQRSFVEPLRTSRHNFKEFLLNTDMAEPELSDAAALRERIKKCELDMEQLQMLAMYNLVIDGDTPEQTRSTAEQREEAQNNLSVYFVATGVKLDPLGQSQVNRLLQAVFS